MTMKDSKRELGKIEDVFSGKEDHDILTLSVGVGFKGAHQGFGSLMLNEKLIISFEKELCDTFDVKNINELIGEACYALRCFDYWNANIEGLESVKTGKKFTLTGWRRRHLPANEIKSPLQVEEEYHNSRISSAQRNIQVSQYELENIKSKYTDWE